MMTYLGLVLAAFLRADQHKEGFDMQVAGRCAIRQVAQSDIGALFLFPFIVKSGALLILLVADVVRSSGVKKTDFGTLFSARPGHVVARRISLKKAHHLAGQERATWTQRATHNDSEHDVAVMDQDTPVVTLTGVLEELYHGHAPIHL
ncbi:hypothetical protein Q7P36_003197 [Cladosporium allicinum]